MSFPLVGNLSVSPLLREAQKDCGQAAMTDRDTDWNKNREAIENPKRVKRFYLGEE